MGLAESWACGCCGCGKAEDENEKQSEDDCRSESQGKVGADEEKARLHGALIITAKGK